MGLSERTFYFGHCGLAIDRDFNAAINLARLAREKQLPEVPA
jgi:transposase